MDKIKGVLKNIKPYWIKFISYKAISAIKGGLVLTMPAMIIGIIVLLIGHSPIDGWNKIIGGIFGTKWDAPFNQVIGGTIDILALIIVFGIAYAYVKNDGYEGVPAGILGMISFLIVTNTFIITEAGEKVSGVIPKSFTGIYGIITAVLIGLLTGYIYALFLKKKIKLRMPKSVPLEVVNAFAPLMPGIAITVVSMIIYSICYAAKELSLTEIIYIILKIPMQR